MLCDKLPRAKLTYLPTPLEEAPRLSAALGGARIWIKRDDRSGLTFGGNKPRIFEYVLGDALAQGCDLTITPAGPQSNHLREVTAAANRLGMKSVLVICGTDGSGPAQGNSLLFRLLGAEIHTFPDWDLDAYYGPELMAFVEELAETYRERGYKPYHVHFGLRPGLLGCAAHVTAAEELAAQFAALGMEPDFLYVPTGSGVSTSGYVLGFKHLGLRTRVVGVGLIYSEREAVREVVRFAKLAAEELGLDTRVEPGDFAMLDVHDRPGYGIVTPEVIEAVRLCAVHEGILLDPVYNGRAMAALIEEVRHGRLGQDRTAVLVHTGGVPALFAQNEALMAE